MSNKLQSVTCPRCNGKKESWAILCGNGQSRQGNVSCSACKGEGAITADHMERIIEGEAMRQNRLSRGLSGREEAKRLGLDPITLNHLEHGRLP